MNVENDPQEKAKKWREQWRATADLAARSQAAYVNYLNDEIDRLTKRVAELEEEPEFTPAVLKRADEIVLGDVVLEGGAIRTVTEIDLEPNIRIIRCEDWRGWHKNDDLIAVLRQPLVEAKTLADMQPPFEGPIERIEPILDPDRLMATARWFLNNSYKDTHEIIAYLIACHCGDSREAKPYKLKGGDREAIPKLLLIDQERDKECRDIVRRLAEFAANEKADAIDLLKVSDDAAELWAKMQQEAKQ